MFSESDTCQHIASPRYGEWWRDEVWTSKLEAKPFELLDGFDCASNDGVWGVADRTGWLAYGVMGLRAKLDLFQY